MSPEKKAALEVQAALINFLLKSTSLFPEDETTIEAALKIAIRESNRVRN